MTFTAISFDKKIIVLRYQERNRNNFIALKKAKSPFGKRPIKMKENRRIYGSGRSSDSFVVTTLQLIR